MEEIRTAKISVAKAGGNASKNALKYRLQLPTSWAQAIGITAVSRDVQLTFDRDGEKIILQKLK